MKVLYAAVYVQLYCKEKVIYESSLSPLSTLVEKVFM